MPSARISPRSARKPASRLWAYNKLIGLIGIVNAYQAGCRNLYEIAEYLDVSEEILAEALECYRHKYGRGEMVNHYFVQFEPTLQVYEYHSVK